MSYVLGIDVGTTTVKAVLVDEGSCTVHSGFSETTQADTPCEIEGSDEQSVAAILASINSVMDKFDKNDLQKVVGIGVSGQMHGCVLWKKAQICFSDSHINLNGDQPCTNLVTWQDSRCSEEFLSRSLPPSCCSRVSTGYGCATLFWLSHHQPDKLQNFDRAGTVMDLIVWALCGGGDVVMMSDQNVASWGYYDNKKGTWEEILNKAPFCHLLPQVSSSPSIAGRLVSAWMGVAAGTPVGVAMGDNQCSVKAACHSEESCAVLSVGTSSQLSVIKPNTDHSPLPVDSPLMEVPYFNCSTLLVAAALNGGNTINKFVRFLRAFLTLAGITEEQVTEQKIYEIITSSALSKLDTTLSIQPLLLGERHCPTERGSVANLTSDNITMADVSSALCRGIVDNLAQMMQDTLPKLKVTKIVGTGSALEKNEALREQVKKVFQLNLELKRGADAPLGVALAIAEKLKLDSLKPKCTQPS